MYNPPYYQLSGNFVTIGGKKHISSDLTRKFIRYNWNTKETFTKDNNGDWNKDPVHFEVSGEYYRRCADAMFLVAYGINFYGY